MQSSATDNTVVYLHRKRVVFDVRRQVRFAILWHIAYIQLRLYHTASALYLLVLRQQKLTNLVTSPRRLNPRSAATLTAFLTQKT